VTVAPATVSGVDHPIIGVSLVENWPFPLTIESGDIGGPSAGLMWTLGLIDLLTPGDLTGGRTLAGTGTIALDGTVGPIGGIQEKVVAAENAGASRRTDRIPPFPRRISLICHAKRFTAQWRVLPGSSQVH